MKAHIIERKTNKRIASIKATLPYGMTIAKGEEVYTIVFDINLTTNERKSIKECANIVFTSHGWTRKTHKIIFEEEE